MAKRLNGERTGDMGSKFSFTSQSMVLWTEYLRAPKIHMLKP